MIVPLSQVVDYVYTLSAAMFDFLDERSCGGADF